MSQVKVGDTVLARGEVLDIIEPRVGYEAGVVLSFGEDRAWVDYEDLSLVDEPKATAQKKPITGVRAAIGSRLIALGLLVVFGPQHGRDLDVKFSEETP